MNSWCESCARKNLCYVVDDRPKCFVPITNTASGTPYLVGISSISRDSHEIAKTEPTISKMEQVETMSCQECKHFHENAVMYLDQCDFCFKDCKYEPKDEPQTNADQHTQSVESVESVGSNLEPFRVDEPQTERSCE